MVDAVDVLTDTQGIDFGAYLRAVVSKVRQKWYSQIPISAKERRGRLAIEFRIQPDGHISDMKLVATAGDVLLDRAAWDGIRFSAPFPKLPAAFQGPELALRFRFYYNPGTAILDVNSAGPDDPVQHAELIRKVASSHIPDYPKAAIDSNIDGVVRMEAVITSE